MTEPGEASKNFCRGSTRCSETSDLTRPFPPAAFCGGLNETLPLEVLEFVRTAHAANTRRAYESDVRHFLEWGGQIPATDRQVAEYLARYAGQLANSTLARRLVAIRNVHRISKLPDPTSSELVRLTFRGIRRKCGGPQRQVAAVRRADLQRLSETMGQSPKDIRDRALLLFGFAGAFRRSELVRLDIEDIDLSSRAGALVQIRRSKTDQESRGRKIGIVRTGDRTCPVAAIEDWIKLSKNGAGAVFRPIFRGGHIPPQRLSADAVARIIKDRMRSIGADPADYSGHSLRAGYVTTAASAGAPHWKIRQQTGHCSDEMINRYIRGIGLLSPSGRVAS